MTEEVHAAWLTELHVAGWTIVRVRGDLDPDRAGELHDRVAAGLVSGACVAVDLLAARNGPAVGVDVLRELAATASRVGARLVTIVAGEQEREGLRGAGVPEVYESLDVALGVTSPVLREAGAPAPPSPLAPASGDAQLVATEDSTGRGEAAR